MAHKSRPVRDISDAEIAERLGWRFRDQRLLREALTHGSVLGEDPDARTYDRLEFLGDRVLGLFMAEHVFSQNDNDQEGALAVRFNALVDREACARAAKRARLGDHAIVATSMRAYDQPVSEAILADVCESIIGALYLDGGFDAAAGFIRRFWAEELREDGRQVGSPKNRLQEWAASKKRRGPDYEIVSREGPDHEPHFIVEVRIEGMDPARGEGPSKRDAERAAAIAMLKSAGLDV